VSIKNELKSVFKAEAVLSVLSVLYVQIFINAGGESCEKMLNY